MLSMRAIYSARCNNRREKYTSLLIGDSHIPREERIPVFKFKCSKVLRQIFEEDGFMLFLGY